MIEEMFPGGFYDGDTLTDVVIESTNLVEFDMKFVSGHIVTCVTEIRKEDLIRFAKWILKEFNNGK